MREPVTTIPTVRGWLVRALMLICMISAPVAHGEPAKQPVIVLKARMSSFDAHRADEIAALIEEQFEAEGFAARPASVARLLGPQLPKPGILDRGLTAADIIRPIELGYDDWSNGLFAEAERKLTSATAKIFRNPALLVSDTRNLDSTFKGLVALALSQARLNKQERSDQTMMELVRIFRTRPVSRGDWGRPAERYWQTVAKPLLAAGTGQLYVSTGNTYAVVFVDGQIRGIGKAEVADLVPGVHRVFVQVPSTAGMQYEVVINANDNTYVDVKWDVDSALVAASPWLGFVYLNEVERDKEAILAGQFADRWGGAVVVVNVIRIQDEPMLVGTLYRARGKVIRGAVTTLDGDASSQVRQLARYLADGTVGTGVKVIPQDPQRAGIESISSLTNPAPPATVIPKLVMGTGALAITAGAIVYARYPYKRGSYAEDKIGDRSLGVMLGGTAVLAGGTYLWLRASHPGGRLTAGAIATGVGAIATGAELYFTDQDEGPFEPARIRDSATAGVVIGVTGIALTGLGVWLWHREGTAPPPTLAKKPGSAGLALSPMVGSNGSETLIGWRGVFP